jgi:predicted O-methyltransferase YrrM
VFHERRCHGPAREQGGSGGESAEKNEYSREVFGQQDGHLAGLMAEATAAGLPDIAVSADVGRLLMILTAMTRARLALEVGTLAGYSGIWIARGLAEGGRLITVEREPAHAAFARAQFERAGVSDRVELRVGAALEVLPRLAGELGPGSVDVVFLDADKAEYADYWALIRPLVAVGGVVLADNVLGTGSEWIDQQDRPQPRAVDRFNRLVAGDDAFEAVVAPLRQGVLIARRFS